MKEPKQKSKITHKATVFLILGNVLLFVLKIIVGILSNSIAIISDAINSLTDIIASLVVFVCVKMGCKRADKEHPFGHHRIEPIAGLIVAIFIAIVGFEIINVSVKRLMVPEEVIFSLVSVSVLVFTMVLKTFMTIYLRSVSKKTNSPAIYASSVDCRNDVFISGTVLLGFVGYKIGYAFLDPLAGLITGLWIIYSGYDVGKSNIDFLIGSSPDKKAIDQLKRTALSIRGVKGLHDVKAHYVGNYAHVEVHVDINKRLNLVRAHNIEKNVQRALDGLPWVDKAFIHVDPVKRPRYSKGSTRSAR